MYLLSEVKGMRNNEIVPRLTPSPVLGEGWGEGVKNKTSTILHGQAVDNVQTCIVIEPDHMITVQTMFGICMLSNRSPVEKPFTGDTSLFPADISQLSHHVCMGFGAILPDSKLLPRRCL